MTEDEKDELTERELEIYEDGYIAGQTMAMRQVLNLVMPNLQRAGITVLWTSTPEEAQAQIAEMLS